VTPANRCAESAKLRIPNASSHRGSTRSVSRPAIGNPTTMASPAGIIITPAAVGE
jgi:hypothetical protein